MAFQECLSVVVAGLALILAHSLTDAQTTAKDANSPDLQSAAQRRFQDVQGSQFGQYDQNRYLEERYEPMPYSFEYSAEDPEGSHSHQATSDGRTVTGQYWIQLADGRQRVVKYVADENGYRAEITTNELGTESKNPADVVIESSAPTGPQAANEGYTYPQTTGRFQQSGAFDSAQRTGRRFGGFQGSQSLSGSQTFSRADDADTAANTEDPLTTTDADAVTPSQNRNSPTRSPIRLLSRLAPKRDAH